MTHPLIREASRRGRAEADRRELQHQVDEAYHSELKAEQDRRQRELDAERRKEERRDRVAAASRNLTYNLFNVGWFALCVFVGYDQSWERVDALDNLLWDMPWVAYVALVVIYLLGRRLWLDLLGYSDRD